ncbi:MAG TPA: ATP-binding protein [Fibrobacteraceae bacterium]|nr:ATP-binding protein [Fibrobacteraceae bacterium]
MSYQFRGYRNTFSSYFPQYGALLLTGPRQAGKYTLLRHLAKIQWGSGWQAFSFDTPADIAQFRQDPELFFFNHPGPLLLDEVQNAPDIFPWLKKMLDQNPGQMRFLLTCSQHFPLKKGVAESMVGRIATAELLPFSQRELHTQSSNDIVACLQDPAQLETFLGQSFPCSDKDVLPRLLLGGYPEQAMQSLGASWFASYRASYLQRDILATGRVEDIGKFDRFLVLCAGLSGTLPNKANLADTLSVDAKTIDHWLSLLEAGYQIFSLPAWSFNTSKRMVKRPKFIFGDSGLGAHLQAIRDMQAILGAPHFGNLFESWVIAEIRKAFCTTVTPFDAYHWCTSNGQKCDLLLQCAGRLIPMEIKHTARPGPNDVKGIVAFRREHRDASWGILFSMNPRVEWVTQGVLNFPIGLLCSNPDAQAE